MYLFQNLVQPIYQFLPVDIFELVRHSHTLNYVIITYGSA